MKNVKLSWLRTHYFQAYAKADVVGDLWVLQPGGIRNTYKCSKRKGFWKKYASGRCFEGFVWNKTTGSQFFLFVYNDANAMAIYETWKEYLNNNLTN